MPVWTSLWVSADFFDGGIVSGSPLSSSGIALSFLAGVEFEVSSASVLGTLEVQGTTNMLFEPPNPSDSSLYEFGKPEYMNLGKKLTGWSAVIVKEVAVANAELVMNGAHVFLHNSRVLKAMVVI